ncbi:hypothetical protein LMH87_005675 [Akanthomyces muscarius]|uniref:Uncharacterized protein n=1 Tax=Akanthomyces muscarius TaxID=2231603 RepID=A0A9W8QPN8_AKAMU|nr:hypothetical protein LMH87_005675 [Akanthomyces muscarius]KAJ4163982.1 hypothetical protein LMH87_005675 [Akanthomyces muscarius]
MSVRGRPYDGRHLQVDFDGDDHMMQLWQKASTTKNHSDTVRLWTYALFKLVYENPTMIGASDSIATPCQVGSGRTILHAAVSGSAKDVCDAEDEVLDYIHLHNAAIGLGTWVLVACGPTAKLWSCYPSSGGSQSRLKFLPVDDATEVTDLQASEAGGFQGIMVAGRVIDFPADTLWLKAVILDDDGVLRCCYRYTTSVIAGERLYYWTWRVPGLPDP